MNATLILTADMAGLYMLNCHLMTLSIEADTRRNLTIAKEDDAYYTKY